MPKDFKKGDDFLLYVNVGTQASPDWELVTAAVNISVDPAPADIVIQEANISDGHMNGFGDPAITFTLQLNKGDSNVLDMIDAMASGDLIEIAVADGDIETAGTTFYRLEACMRGALNANRGEAASWDVTANRHVNSVADLTKVVATTLAAEGEALEEPVAAEA